jgi:hypothetical protein
MHLKNKINKTGKQFEILTKEIFELLSRNERYTSVEHNVQLESPDGLRQIDVLIRSKSTSLDLMTIVECKDHNRILSVEYIDAIYSKKQDVRADIAVLVARKGFSKSAKHKADRLGIKLCIARDAERQLRNIGLQIPVLIREIHGIQVYPCFQAYLEAGTELNADSVLKVNDINIAEAFRNAFISGEIQFKATGTKERWIPSFITEPTYIRDVNGQRLAINDYSLMYEIEVNYYFGYVNELPQTISLINLSQSREDIFFKAEDLFDYKNTLVKYSSEKDVPIIKGICIESVTLPNIEFRNVELNLKRIE